MDIQKDKDFTSLPEIAKLYQACKERDLTIAEREYLKGARDAWQAAKAQAVPEGFGLFDGDTLTYSNGYSINCSFDDEFDCHVFDVSKDGCYIKTGMTQLEQAHCLVLSMIKLDAKDSMLEAQEPTND